MMIIRVVIIMMMMVCADVTTDVQVLVRVTESTSLSLSLSELDQRLSEPRRRQRMPEISLMMGARGHVRGSYGEPEVRCDAGGNVLVQPRDPSRFAHRAIVLRTREEGGAESSWAREVTWERALGSA
eukprot:2272926-Rhodomonas_salina.1